MARITKQPVSTFSPYYGCAIMAAAALIFGGILAWSAYTLFRQDAEIEKITTAEPAAFAEGTLPPDEQRKLETRLASFERSALAGQPATLELTLAEINALVAMAPDLGNGSYVDIVRFTATDPADNALIGQISLPLNTLKFWEKKFRHLVGEATFKIEVIENGPDARITDIRVPGREVPSGFIETQAYWTWLAPFQKDKDLAAVLKTIRHAQVTPQGLLLATQPPP